MPRTRSLVAVAAAATLAGCFSDLGAGVTGAVDPTGSTSTDPTAATTTSTSTGPALTTGVDTTGAAPCGNGVVEPDEQCDLGASNGDDSHCTAQCTLDVCGDGNRGPDEGCDDGGLIAGDGCDAQCRGEECGNGLVNAGEDCDDANDVETDACTSLCHPPTCGDGLKGAGEECDDANLDDGDGCTTACLAVGCGNGVLEASEECDDGNRVDDDGCAGCIRTFFRVFVTSNAYRGDFGGVAAADKLCSDRAAAGGLPGTYSAWIATSPDDAPTQRFTHAQVPYVLPDRQTIVAESFDALLVGLVHPIDQDENATPLVPTTEECGAERSVWTGLLNNGGALGQNCSAWQLADGAQFGNAGYLDVAADWSSICAIGCDQSLRLYCFQQ